ncbi:MAG: undecaprenyl/decaprenyl-phosphate alpha-N-acetylglucosaminyl 1-phosphate transferase, partial [Syntrophales bacterium LBB04]|nr:undecaprenyl/decaprenyl-phosphate alpha-N-acetylglucosaminyl 1-phosphate transferase [Syntrophales bacterium LBB04]
WAKLEGFLAFYAAGALVITLCGLFDDTKGLRPGPKLAGQVTAALMVIIPGEVRISTLGSLLPEQVLLPEWAAIALTLLVIVGVTNAINLSDGLDGLAGGICLLSLACIGYLAYIEENLLIALLATALCGAIIGFLRFNTYPAALFMGDTGSQLLGFSVITLSLKLTQGNTALSPLLPLLALGLPVLDTMMVIGERIAQHRPLFIADNNHIHHRLIRLGLFHTEAVFSIYLLQAGLVVSALLLRFDSEWTLLVGYVMFSVLAVGGLWVAELYQWKIKRYHFIDKVVKARLRAIVREDKFLIRGAFGAVKVGLPALLLVTCLVPAGIPGYISVMSGIACCLLLVFHVLNGSLMRRVMVAALYLFIPFAVYFSEETSRFAAGSVLQRLYTYAFPAIVFFVIMTLKLTRRRQGFRATPMDFLTLFIGLAMPFLPGHYLGDTPVGAIAAKTVMFFFSYEVLIGELREQLRAVKWTTIAALGLVAIRGIL